MTRININSCLNIFQTFKPKKALIVILFIVVSGTYQAKAQERNTFFGTDAGDRNTTGDDNSFFGYFAGKANTSGSHNSFLGREAGLSNNIGSNNTFIGTAAGKANTSGEHNTFLGRSSGFNNVSGSSNTFVGRSVGYNNTIGAQNTFSGSYSGVENTIGSNNSFYGYLSGNANTTGAQNTFSGSYSGAENTTGNNNVFYGFVSGRHNITGSDNTFMGINSGRANNSGERNSYIGSYTGSNSTGDYNTFVGSYAGNRSGNSSSSVFIGYEAGYDEANPHRLHIANARDTTLIYGHFYNVTNDGVVTPPAVGIATKDLVEMFNVAGAINIGNTETENAGSIRWTGEDFEGYDGENWLSLSHGEADKISALQDQVDDLLARIAALEGPNAMNDEFPVVNLLEQNNPNPFNVSTQIRFFVPQSTRSASIHVFDMTGKQLQQIPIAQKGSGSIHIEAGSLEAGMFIYSLVLDDKVADTKRMLLTK